MRYCKTVKQKKTLSADAAICCVLLALSLSLCLRTRTCCSQRVQLIYYFPIWVLEQSNPCEITCDINVYLCMGACVCLCVSVDVAVCTLLWHLEANQWPADCRC